MEKKDLRRLIFYCGIIGFLLIPFNNYGQAIKRQCISSYGAVVSNGQQVISQTAGQSYNTLPADKNNVNALAGFQQADVFVLEVIEQTEPVDLNLEVYPNPAIKTVFICSSEPMQDYNLQVTNANGKTMVSEKLNETLKYELHCENWSNGVYLITVSDSQFNKETLKLVISK